MQHFQLEDWVDFVRDVASGEQKSRLQNHLDQGCNDCIKTVRAWRSVAKSAKQELSYEPPTSSINIARSYFSGYRSIVSQAASFRIAVLAFDSLQSAVLGGIRSGEQAPRQLMYNCGDVVIDLRAIAKPASHQMALVGQVANGQEEFFAMEGLALSVLQDGETLQQTSSNEFGEFQLLLPSSENLQLLIAMKGAMVVLHLPKFDGEGLGM
jgi:hypothetical protein